LKKPLNICVIGPSLTMGGMERASINLSSMLHESGHQITHFTVLKQKHFFELPSGIRLVEPENFNVKSLSIFKTMQWIRKDVRQINPDCIIVFNKFYAALVSIALLFTSSKIIISERSSPLYNWPLKFKIINKIAFMLNTPTGVICQTNIATEYQKKYYSSKSRMKTIPNILRDVKTFSDINREKFVLGVGRLDEDLKGIDRLIDAFSKIKNKEWKLVLAGNDDKAQFLKDQVFDLNISERVSFLGPIKNIDEQYAKAGIFVIPSRSEGFPNALVEAMAAGLPCISFDFVAGPRDIIENNLNGIIVENDNIEAMANAIDNLIADEDKRNQLSAASIKIKDRLSANSIKESYEGFIIECLSN
jgi:glycosyltransferase involved in cell wall biosynthesis